jgi:hypothetical protein
MGQTKTAMITAFRTSRTGASMPRMLVALLVLTIWLAAPLLLMPLASPVAGTSDAVTALLAAQTICHAGDPHDVGSDRRGPAHPADHGHDCGMCPICHVMGTPILAPTAFAALAPPPGLAEAAPVALPPATGPPPVLRAAASPRGPPARSV